MKFKRGLWSLQWSLNENLSLVGSSDLFAQPALKNRTEMSTDQLRDLWYENQKA